MSTVRALGPVLCVSAVSLSSMVLGQIRLRLASVPPLCACERSHLAAVPIVPVGSRAVAMGFESLSQRMTLDLSAYTASPVPEHGDAHCLLDWTTDEVSMLCEAIGLGDHCDALRGACLQTVRHR